jgi:PadR family transcriptional regulator PadR
MEPVAQTREEVARPTASSPFTPSSPASRPVDTFLGNWIVQARKGLLELSVLTALEGSERYGYEIVRDMAARPALGGAEGTVYPMLARLEDRGLLRTTLRNSGHGPTHKYYTLTTDGQYALQDMRARFRELISGVLREDDGELPPQGARIGLRRVAR